MENPIGWTTITFDFDGTLKGFRGPNASIIQIFKSHQEQGLRVGIVTSRIKNPKNTEISDFCAENKIKPAFVIHTNSEDKWMVLKTLGSICHYDDDEWEIEKIKEFLPDVAAYLVRESK